jgi:hypothetical protein
VAHIVSRSRGSGSTRPAGEGREKGLGRRRRSVLDGQVLAVLDGHAEQLAKIPASYRIVSCPELKEAARLLGQRLLAASESGFTPQRGTAPRPGREC